VVASLGTTWRVTALAHKPFPSGRWLIALVERLEDVGDVRELIRATVP
jgi:hypothetical protein